MIKYLPKYLLIFFVCLLLQVAIFNEMQISRFLNPSFYVLFILLLPFETPKWLQLISAFALGIIADAFLNTPGINTAASVLMAFSRPGILNLISPREGYESGSFPGISDMGFVWFLKYSLSLILIHQLCLYFTEAMSFRFIDTTIIISIANTITTTFFIIISQYIMFRTIMNKPEPRTYIIGGIVIATALTMLIRLFYLQVVSDEYEVSALNNSQRHIIQYPPRGIIYDRDSNIIVSNKAAYDLMVIPRQVKEIDSLKLANALGIDMESFRLRLAKARLYSQFQPSTFYKMLSAEEYAGLQEILYAYEGFFVQPRVVRQYKGQNGAHILGDIGEVNQNILDKDPYYKVGDYCGVNGIEKSYEKILRGQKGVRIYLVDAHNRIKESYKNGKYDTLPEAGKSIVSTIDMDLQAYGEKLFKNKIGSLVAIEPATGEILAMVSSPTFDPNLLVGRERGMNYDSLLKTDNKPLYNRAIAAPYPPGSTFKVAQAMVALDEGVIFPYTGFPCNKSLVNCHNHPEPTNVSKAIQFSCNPYFYQVFKRMVQRGYESSIFRDSPIGLDLWKEKITLLGFGQALDIGLPGVSPGQIPGSDYYDALYGQYRWAFSTIYSLSIGQGEISATPLQLAHFASIIANRGSYYTPHLVKSIEGNGLEEKYSEKHVLPFDQSIYPPIIKGMEDAVNAPLGTAALAKIEGITVCGKTGTAQNPHGEDHSIFMAFAPKENPDIAIAVYVENAGFGGTWAAPIAGLMIEHYLNDSISNTWGEERILNANLIPEKETEDE